MRQSELVTRTVKDSPKEEVSVNAKLLYRAGFVDRLWAGVYSYLPLGCRVLAKVEQIIREEMTRIGSQEVLMPGLHPKEIWETTKRWNDVDVLYKLEGDGGRELALGPTHEEVVTPLIGRFIHSYKDLPKSVFQIQTKFRNEVRAKSGILRGREFRMKDMYSFHTDQADLDRYYDLAIIAYRKVFERAGLGDVTYLTFASGGMFSKYSHEFQTLTPYGEDEVYLWEEKKIAVNKEILAEVKSEPEWAGADFKPLKAIEVGNIFKLGTRFSDACSVGYQDQAGQKKPVPMGCYGIGSTRLIGAIVEVHHDEKGICWPKEVSPFDVHLIGLGTSADEKSQMEKAYQEIQAAGISVLFDDRDMSPGQKFMDSDLIGIPWRVVVSSRAATSGGVEVKRRTNKEAQIMPFDSMLKLIRT